MNTLRPDVTLVLDSACIVREAITANEVSEEAVDRWTGRPWAETVSGVETSALSGLLLRCCHENVPPIFRLTQEFPSGSAVPFEYLVFRRDNGSEFVAIGRDLRRRFALSGRPETSLQQLHGTAGCFGQVSLEEAVASAVSLVERYYIEAALEAVGGNRTAAARMLGVSRQGLYDKLARYEIVARQDTP